MIPMTNADIHIEKGVDSPMISFDSHYSLLRIEGRSLMEDPYDFYKDLIQWMKDYVTEMTAPVTIEIKLVYFNSSSGRYLLELLMEADKKASLFNVVWLAEEDDEVIIEKGTEFKFILKMPFKIRIYG